MGTRVYVNPVIQQRVDRLKKRFGFYVREYNRRPALGNEQLRLHEATIALRRQLGSAKAAVRNDEFRLTLLRTLESWGVDKPQPVLPTISDFGDALRRNEVKIAALDGISLEDARLDSENIGRQIFALIQELGASTKKAKVVPGTLALHHLLPDLVPPMHRDTVLWGFLRRHRQQLHMEQEAVFRLAFAVFADLAAVKPSQYIGRGPWDTCLTKVLENAVTGYVMKEGETPRLEAARVTKEYQGG